MHATYVVFKWITSRYGTGRYWRYGCACGYRSGYTYSHVPAAAAAFDHVSRVHNASGMERAWRMFGV